MRESYPSKAAIAGLSCATAGSLLNPVDVVKIRMQNHSAQFPWPEKNFARGILHIFREEGAKGLLRGVDATIMRELFYSSIRMGAYEPVLAAVVSGDTHKAGPAAKLFSAMVSGAVGSVLANPTDLVKVMLQAQVKGAEGLPFKSAKGEFRHVYGAEGVRGLYKGWEPTTVRAAMLTAAQLGSYDIIKNNILIETFNMMEGTSLHLICSLLAGVITTTASNPADVIKTRYMSDSANKYTGPLDCVVSTFRESGIKAFFRGWTASYLRIGPHTIISFLLIEQGRTMLGFRTI